MPSAPGRWGQIRPIGRCSRESGERQRPESVTQRFADSSSTRDSKTVQVLTNSCHTKRSREGHGGISAEARQKMEKFRPFSEKCYNEDENIRTV